MTTPSLSSRAPPDEPGAMVASVWMRSRRAQPLPEESCRPRADTTPVVTEVRAGTYVYGDRACIADGTASMDDCALRVEATVVSRPTAGRAILDAGSKTLSSDPVAGHPELNGFGLVLEHPGARLYALNEEHGYLDLSECPDPPAIGDVVTIVPNHACIVSNLHDQVVVRQAGSPAAVWRVAARGLVR